MAFNLYGLLIALGVLLCLWHLTREGKRLRLPADLAIDMVLYAVPLGIIGARLYYVAFTWSSYKDNWLSIFYIWQGGLAIYGAIIGGGLGLLLLAKKRRLPWGTLLDMLAPALLMAQAVGRWGNFFNGEAFGRIITNPKLQFFPVGVFVDGAWHEAAFFYESAWNLLGAVILYLNRKRGIDKGRPGHFFLYYLIWYGLGRMVIEGLRTDSLMWGPFRVSQVLSALMVLFGLFILFVRPRLNRWPLYRLMLSTSAKPAGPLRPAGSASEAALDRAVTEILQHHRVTGAGLAIFDDKAIRYQRQWGNRNAQEPVTADTVFRVASVSKMATAALVMRLKDLGLIDIDRDIDSYLPFSVRHPGAPDRAITLAMLMSHQSGIKDSPRYLAHAKGALDLTSLLDASAFTAHLPGEGIEYSNLGAALVASVLENALGQPFDDIAQTYLFGPLGMSRSSFYPQRIQGVIADARRILPPSARADYDPVDRLTWPLPERSDLAAPQLYPLAQGALLMSVSDAVKLGQALMRPGFLSAEALNAMREKRAAFGARARNLSQGLGTFIVEDKDLGAPFFGHQGMAYGAVHMLAFDPDKDRGLVFFTVGASEARRGILADVNKAMLSLWREQT